MSLTVSTRQVPCSCKCHLSHMATSTRPSSLSIYQSKNKNAGLIIKTKVIKLMARLTDKPLSNLNTQLINYICELTKCSEESWLVPIKMI
ncbi:hypothetical protein HanRHA438_Chr15g0683411 [Helianthus annuus]|nr:hypothetical protein HanRHA438_Chr15g0683411 [Helianthus annuus]